MHLSDFAIFVGLALLGWGAWFAAVVAEERRFSRHADEAIALTESVKRHPSGRRAK